MKYSLPTKLLSFHSLFSLFIVILPFLFFYNIWYPSKFSLIAAGQSISYIFISVEIGLVVSFALLMFLGRNNTKKEIITTYIIFLCLQFGTTVTGFKALYDAKPLYVVYEFNRFRVVRPIDIFWGESEKEYALFSGPKFFSALSLSSTDPRFLQSIKDSSNGLHPSFKRDRLVSYLSVKKEIINNSENPNNLKTQNFNKIRIEAAAIGYDVTEISYYPLVSQLSDEWIVLVDIKTAKILSYMNINGWDHK